MDIEDGINTEDEDDFDETYRDINEANYEEFGGVKKDMSSEEFMEHMEELLRSYAKIPKIYMINPTVMKKAKGLVSDLKEILDKTGEDYKIEIEENIEFRSLGVSIIFEYTEINHKNFNKIKNMLDIVSIISIDLKANKEISIDLVVEDAFFLVDADEEAAEEY